MRFTIRNYRPEDFRTLLAIDQSCFAPGISYSAFELKTYIEPDTNAARLWLLNRRPENWRERSVTEITGDPEKPVIHEIRRTIVRSGNSDG